MALVGWASNVPNFTCGLRALAGAAVLFVLVKTVGRIVANIVARAIVDHSYRQRSGGSSQS